MSEVLPGFDIQGIVKLLPHRYPFVLIDRILSYTKGKSITGLKNVSVNEPFFPGHFPEEHVMPGVLMIEGLAQTGAILAYLSEPETVGVKLLYFTGIDKAKFRKRVIPGDQIIYDIEIMLIQLFESDLKKKYIYIILNKKI